MTRRGKITLAVLVIGSVLGLVAATNAWFIAVTNTPPGAVSSALVHWLPDTGARSFTSLLEYGNLISGSSVDAENIALLMPNESLLPGSVVDASKKQTVRTSIARTFEAGETVDTVIHWEVRRRSGIELIYKQRDLMDARSPTDEWFEHNSETVTKLSKAPQIDLAKYNMVTNTTETVTAETTPQKKTITTIATTTTYTPRSAEGNLPTYKHVITTVKAVTHEEAEITPDAEKDNWGTADLYLTATETVLFADNGSARTRSYIVIDYPNSGKDVSATGSDGKYIESSVPLALGNLSTVESNVRIGIVAYLTPKNGAPTALTLKEQSGTYYLGTDYPSSTDADKKFIELFSFTPYAKDTGYQWTRVAEKTPGSTVWSLWDLVVGGSAVVPAPSAAATPDRYLVTDSMKVVENRTVGVSGAETDVEFERCFNTLYCDTSPTITLRLSYYTKQSKYMDWAEFYSQELHLDMSKYTTTP